MGTYSASCKENTGNKTSSISRTKQHRLTLVLNCCLWQEKLRFIKNQEACVSEFHYEVFSKCFVST